jgi:hypothetical protein
MIQAKKKIPPRYRQQSKKGISAKDLTQEQKKELARKKEEHRKRVEEAAKISSKEADTVRAEVKEYKKRLATFAELEGVKRSVGIKLGRKMWEKEQRRRMREMMRAREEEKERKKREKQGFISRPGRDSSQNNSTEQAVSEQTRGTGSPTGQA